MFFAIAETPRACLLSERHPVQWGQLHLTQRACGSPSAKACWAVASRRKCKEPPALHKPCGSFLAMGPPLPRACVWFLGLGPGPFQTRCLARFLSPERNGDKAEEESGRSRRGAVTQQRNRSQGPAFRTCSRCVLPPVPAMCPQLTTVAACSESFWGDGSSCRAWPFLSLSFLSKGFIKILGRQRQRHHLESLGEFCHRAETHQQCLGAACCGALASLWWPKDESADKTQRALEGRNGKTKPLSSFPPPSYNY